MIRLSHISIGCLLLGGCASATLDVKVDVYNTEVVRSNDSLHKSFALVQKELSGTTVDIAKLEAAATALGNYVVQSKEIVKNLNVNLGQCRADSGHSIQTFGDANLLMESRAEQTAATQTVKLKVEAARNLIEEILDPPPPPATPNAKVKKIKRTLADEYWRVVVKTDIVAKHLLELRSVYSNYIGVLASDMSVMNRNLGALEKQATLKSDNPAADIARCEGKSQEDKEKLNKAVQRNFDSIKSTLNTFRLFQTSVADTSGADRPPISSLQTFGDVATAVKQANADAAMLVNIFGLAAQKKTADRVASIRQTVRDREFYVSQLDRLQDPADEAWEKIKTDPLRVYNAAQCQERSGRDCHYRSSSNEDKWKEISRSRFRAEGNTSVVMVRERPGHWVVKQAANDPSTLIQSQLDISRSLTQGAITILKAGTGLPLPGELGGDTGTGKPEDGAKDGEDGKDDADKPEATSPTPQSDAVIKKRAELAMAESRKNKAALKSQLTAFGELLKDAEEATEKEAGEDAEKETKDGTIDNKLRLRVKKMLEVFALKFPAPEKPKKAEPDKPAEEPKEKKPPAQGADTTGSGDEATTDGDQTNNDGTEDIIDDSGGDGDEAETETQPNA